MADKIASGVIAEYRRPEDASQVNQEERDARVEAAKAKRDSSRWSMAVGVAMMFGGTFSSALAVGGAVMVVGGFAGSILFARQMRRLQGDPWAPDPELDKWEADIIAGRDPEDVDEVGTEAVGNR